MVWGQSIRERLFDCGRAIAPIVTKVSAPTYVLNFLHPSTEICLSQALCDQQNVENVVFNCSEIMLKSSTTSE